MEEFVQDVCTFAWSVVHGVNNGSLRGNRFKGDTCVFSKNDVTIRIDQEVTNALWPKDCVYDECCPNTGKILKRDINSDGVFTLVIECEELAVEDNGDGKFKWT